ncbi:MAG: NADH-quinone oxidoreductase subunit NuoF [Oscillospiraceae bacterium]|jgi:NADH-quinone oxidoreductase subunit F
MKINGISDLNRIKEEYAQRMSQYRYQALVCGGTGCVSANCAAVEKALREALDKHGIADQVKVIQRGCMGTCAVGPVVYVLPDETYYTELNPEKMAEIVESHFVNGKPINEYTFYDNTTKQHVPNIKEVAFFRDQVRIALRNCGLIDVRTINAYIARDGYFALANALQKGRDYVIEEIKASGLRGRGGAGFPTGVKWEAGKNQKADQKYIICNADEGDPGAFMDRSIFEGDPHSVIEGMLLGGYAIGASKGYVYIRAEYPIAVERLRNAIDAAREVGLLGENIMGSGFDFDLEIRIGAGAFVCGEETALMNSVEGKRGEPRQKPPFPFESGLFGCPTIINNVETLANVPAIMLNGAAWFRSFGTEKSPGTKVFALSGKIVNTGLVEVPMGIPLGDILYKIGGGILNGKNFKAIQSGGPSGGCLTSSHLNTPVDYESLASVGSIMGSGGLIVMDEDTCMVDTARYFMDFIKDESCGKCVPCRIGTRRMLEILERITEGRGEEGDIELLEELAGTLKEAAMCGLGQTAANPILSTIRYFRDEYETHIHDKHCASGVCSSLYTSPCRNACPASVNVPGYMALVSAGRLMDAYRLIRQDNPFPAVCGRVCTHPCENHCRRGQVDEPLAICSIKRFIGDYALRDEFLIPEIKPLPATGKRVAIIGAGPSGLSCAFYLAHLGHEVHVYEAESVAGGVLYWGIPEYRLPKAVLAKEIKAIENAGVKIHLNTRVGTDISVDTLHAENDAIYISVGTQKSRLLGIPGEDLPGVESGLGFLRRVGLNIDRSVPERLVVLGGGSTAMDVARTAVRLGAKEVSVVYRRSEDQMPAGADEVEEAKEEGVRIITMAAPLEVLEKDGKVAGIRLERTQLGKYGKDGRREAVAVPGDTFEIECDGVVTAVNQEIDARGLKVANALPDSPSLIIDRFTSKTGTDGIFAGGDASPWGAKVVISAIADGKRAASNIDIYLGGTGELNKGEEIDIPVIEDTEVVTPHGRFPISMLTADQRRDNFCEVVCGFHRLDAMAESLRCLHCDRR